MNYSIEEITQKVKELFKQQFNLTEADCAKNYFDGVIANSIDALELLLKIENEFSICIDDEDLSAELIQSINNISQYVNRKLNS